MPRPPSCGDADSRSPWTRRGAGEDVRDQKQSTAPRRADEPDRCGQGDGAGEEQQGREVPEPGLLGDEVTGCVPSANVNRIASQ